MKTLKFDNINKIYPGNVQAVFDFNLEVDEGEFIVFLGPSGCGKSTVLRMIAGLEEISNGSLTLGDKVINNLAPQDRDISFVFQDYVLYGNMTVYENIGMSLKVRHVDNITIHEKVIPTSKLIGLDDYLNRVPGQLSGGQKQRVALGRAIARQPKVFLMDEPLSNLDAKLRTETRREIMKLQRDLGVTTVYVTHDQVEAMAMADRIVLLKDGRIQQIGSPIDVYNNPTNMFVASFIGTPQINFIKGDINGNNLVVNNYNIKLSDAQIELLNGRTEVVLGLRPEFVSMVYSHDENTFELEILSSEYCGDFTTVTLGLGDTKISAKSKYPLKKDQTMLNVHFDVENAVFFDAETEQAIKEEG